MEALQRHPSPPEIRDLRAWREAVRQLLSSAWRTVRLVADAGRRAALAVALAQGFDALAGVLVAAVGKRLVDAVVDASAGRSAVQLALGWVAVEGVLVVARTVAQQVSSAASVVLRSDVGRHVNLRVLEKAANVSYKHFEDPAFLNRMNLARREATWRPLGLFQQTLTFATGLVTLVGYAFLLLPLGAWSILFLAATAVPPFLATAVHGRRAFEQQRARSERNRRAFYLESAMTQEASAREVKIFSLASWIASRYREIHDGFHREEVDLALRRARWLGVLGSLATLATYGVYTWIVLRAARGGLSLGSMTLYLMLFRTGQSTLASVLGSVVRAYEDQLYATSLFEFLDTPEDEPDAPIPGDATAFSAPCEVRFESVGFRYPGADRDALADVSFTMAPGRTVALVGANGAGKTTLVKLLVGLHAPTRGRILLDGQDMATLPRAEIRRRIGVIFQDFVRWHFSADENVGVGWIPSVRDDEAIASAVDAAGAGEVMASLPEGGRTPLGRAFGGNDLSVGQWQRIALARAFMRRSGLLVLDEPTAALDPESEHDVFERLRTLRNGRTALLVTHRLATVRSADDIVVLDEGRVAEAGTHAGLMAHGGIYARLFSLQASGFLDG